MVSNYQKFIAVILTVIIVLDIAAAVYIRPLFSTLEFTIIILTVLLPLLFIYLSYIYILFSKPKPKTLLERIMFCESRLKNGNSYCATCKDGYECANGTLKEKETK